MSFTMEDFKRQFFREHFLEMTPEERREILELLSPEEQEAVLQALPPEVRLAGLTEEQVRRYLDRLSSERPAQSRKPQRKR